MASLQWLNGCKHNQLAAIAFHTGLNLAGTNPVLISRLRRKIPHSQLLTPPPVHLPNNKPRTILSIDMGLRNLAYCIIALPPAASLAPAEYPTPVVKRWRRTNLFSTDAPEGPSAEHETELEFDPSHYAPAGYASRAYKLVTRLLFPHSHATGLTLNDLQPTHILIERQRFRSMGGSAVQEWTLRVNVFEAMLYAVLETYQRQGKWRGEVYPIDPSKVTRFWLGESRSNSESKRTPQGTKNAKVDLVGRWVEQAERFVVDGGAKDAEQEFVRKRAGGKTKIPREEAEENESGAKKEKVTSKKSITGKKGGEKLDDLADSLLQGMAWLKWEENKSRILREGIEGVDGLKEGVMQGAKDG